jgi:hypothetical protein
MTSCQWRSRRSPLGNTEARPRSSLAPIQCLMRTMPFVGGYYIRPSKRPVGVRFERKCKLKKCHGAAALWEGVGPLKLCAPWQC